MPTCKFCNESNLEWYQESERWMLGTKIDINVYRKHTCVPKNTEKSNNKRNWVKYVCKICNCEVRQNLKLVEMKTLNVCRECQYYEDVLS